MKRFKSMIAGKRQSDVTRMIGYVQQSAQGHSAATTKIINMTLSAYERLFKKAKQQRRKEYSKNESRR